MNLSCDFPLIECVEPEHEVPGEDGVRPAGKWSGPSSLHPARGPRREQKHHLSLYSPQNKVLAVLDAIKAAQYLVSQNATHLINLVSVSYSRLQAH